MTVAIESYTPRETGADSALQSVYPGFATHRRGDTALTVSSILRDFLHLIGSFEWQLDFLAGLALGYSFVVRLHPVTDGRVVELYAVPS